MSPLWTALLATLALAGCSANLASSASDGGAGEDSGDIFSGGDAGSDAIVACASRSGYFACGPGTCSRAIQACVDGLCEWYGDIDASCGVCPIAPACARRR